MKKSLLTLAAILALSFTFGTALAQQKPAPAEEPAVPAVTEEKAAEAPAEKPAKKTTKKAVAAKKVTKGETLKSLLKAFKAVHSDVVFAEKYTNTKAEGFDKAMAKALANDLMKWKKLKIEVKKLKAAKSPKAASKGNALKELEESILAKYTESAEAAKPEEAVTDEENSPKTEKGREILEKLKNKQMAKDGAEEKAAEAPAEKPAEKPAVKEASNIRVEPSRALYNRIEPAAEATTKITLKNRAKSVYEGTVVPVENWITVNPTTVTIEPGSKIDVDVTIKAQETSKSRLEGSIELRTEGESSKRVPVVVRTK
ncbi:MAG TPA: hypothetical protein PKK26_09565 [Candidatus Wallbacteria bacterium]|nr:hypothetical protein [Candidatus Wallbacteria bacterium]